MIGILQIEHTRAIRLGDFDHRRSEVTRAVGRNFLLHFLERGGALPGKYLGRERPAPFNP